MTYGPDKVKFGLVIDDDSHLCTMMQEILRAEGYEISVPADGEQGNRVTREATSVAADH
jgi:DNA-binding response OmpR family regulator